MKSSTSQCRWSLKSSVRPRETVAQGLASAPETFMGLLKGRNFGKQLVKLIP